MRDYYEFVLITESLNASESRERYQKNKSRTSFLNVTMAILVSSLVWILLVREERYQQIQEKLLNYHGVLLKRLFPLFYFV